MIQTPHIYLKNLSTDISHNKITDRWKFTTFPHIIADSAFGNNEILETIQTKWPEVAIISFAEDKSLNLWNILTWNVAIGHWRYAVQRNILALTNVGKDDKTKKRTVKHLISTGFHVKPLQLTNTNVIPLDEDNKGKDYITFLIC